MRPGELLRQRFAGEDTPDDVVDVVRMQADRDSELAHVAEESLREAGGGGDNLDKLYPSA